MAELTVETVIERRLADTQKRREDLLNKRAEIEEQLHAVEDEYQRVKNADAALKGTLHIGVPAEPKPRKARTASGPRAPRGALGGKRKEVYDYIVAHPNGLFASEVIKHFNPSGDDKIKSAVNAALFNLKKQGRISQSEPRAQYVAAGKTDQPEAAATDEEAA